MRFEAKHGHTAQGIISPEYRCWSSIKSRCLSQTHDVFDIYGGSGITICDEWKDNFQAFFDYVGPRPSALHSIDRYPNRNGNYEPGNVRWATKKEQTHNRDYTRTIIYQGKEQPLIEVARQLGISWPMVRGRINRGWSFDRALFEPFKYYRGRPRCATTR